MYEKGFWPNALDVKAIKAILLIVPGGTIVTIVGTIVGTIV